MYSYTCTYLPDRELKYFKRSTHIYGKWRPFSILGVAQLPSEGWHDLLCGVYLQVGFT